MQVSVEQLDPCKVELTITVDTDQTAKAVEEAYVEYSKVTKIPGFRPGKAPRALVQRYVSEDSINRYVAETVIPDAYKEAIKQEDIKPFTDPDLDLVSFGTGEPLVFKAVVQLPPKMTLGEYKGIEVERKTHVVTDEEVEAQLQRIRESRTTSEKVEDRGAEVGDIMVVEMATAPVGEEMPELRRSLLEVGKNFPGLDDTLVGMKPEERKTFEVDYPETDVPENLAGKKVCVDVLLHSIRKRIVPELNDEFAKQLGSESIEAVRLATKVAMQKSADDESNARVESGIIEKIIERSELAYPDALVDHYAHDDIHDLEHRLSQQGIPPQIYLKQIGKTEEEFIADVREHAAQRVKVGLVIGEVIEKENIEVSDEEIDAEMDRLAESSDTTREAVEEFFSNRGGRDSLRNSLVNRKVMDFLKSVSVIKE